MSFFSYIWFSSLHWWPCSSWRSWWILTFSGYSLSLRSRLPAALNFRCSKSSFQQWVHCVSVFVSPLRNLTIHGRFPRGKSKQQATNPRHETVGSIWTLNKTNGIKSRITGGLDKRPPTLSGCYCYFTSPLFTRKNMVAFHFRGFEWTTPGSAPDNTTTKCSTGES